MTRCSIFDLPCVEPTIFDRRVLYICVGHFSPASPTHPFAPGRKRSARNRCTTRTRTQTRTRPTRRRSPSPFRAAPFSFSKSSSRPALVGLLLAVLLLRFRMLCGRPARSSSFRATRPRPHSRPRPRPRRRCRLIHRLPMAKSLPPPPPPPPRGSKSRCV